MNIKLLYIGKNKSNNIETLIAGYDKKIKQFINFQIHCPKNKNKSSQEYLIIKSDSETILKNIKSIDRKLNHNGRAIIAGILNNQKYMILNKLRGLGLVLELEYVINGWVTLLIKKN